MGISVQTNSETTAMHTYVYDITFSYSSRESGSSDTIVQFISTYDKGSTGWHYSFHHHRAHSKILQMFQNIVRSRFLFRIAERSVEDRCGAEIIDRGPLFMTSPKLNMTKIEKQNVTNLINIA